MSVRSQLDPVLVEYLDDVLKVCSSRARFVINTILENGSITSEDLRDEGYVHGARAIGDVRDNGVPLITQKTKSRDGRNIARYVFGDTADIKRHKFGGRINFPSKLKSQLLERDGAICSISQQELPESELQIDHRVPYFISGDIKGEQNPDGFMLLSKPMQRAKSWECEHCDNLLIHSDTAICETCYWAYPGNYKHVAMKELRMVTLTWEGEEVKTFDSMDEYAQQQGKSIQDVIKDLTSDKFG
jgi:hypothetical protein